MAKKTFLVDLDLNKNQLLNAVLQNLTTHPTNVPNGFVYYNTVDKAFYGNVGGSSWVNLSDIYNHPTYSALNPTLTGANVLASFETDEGGNVIEATTRLLTLSDLGYTGATNANYYTHPTFSGNDLGSPLTGATVISDVNVNNEGHVTGFTTRNLTAADVGAAVINDSVTNQINTWSSQKIQDELDSINSNITGALVYKGGYNASTNTPALSGTTTGITKGSTYTITTAGTFNGQSVQVGDMIIAEVENPSGAADWTIVNKNIPDIVDATDVNKGIIRIATQSEVNAGTSTNTAVTPATLVSYVQAQVSGAGYATSIGDGTATSFDITHGLNTKDVVVQAYEDSTGDDIVVLARRTSTSQVRILVNQALTNNQIRVVILKKTT